MQSRGLYALPHAATWIAVTECTVRVVSSLV